TSIEDVALSNRATIVRESAITLGHISLEPLSSSVHLNRSARMPANHAAIPVPLSPVVNLGLPIGRVAIHELHVVRAEQLIHSSVNLKSGYLTAPFSGIPHGWQLGRAIARSE